MNFIFLGVDDQKFSKWQVFAFFTIESFRFSCSLVKIANVRFFKGSLYYFCLISKLVRFRFDIVDITTVDTADRRHPVSQEPRGVHAEEAGGRYPERGQLHQVLDSM